jgi:RNA polymerase sigma factor (sigma-70 family)
MFQTKGANMATSQVNELIEHLRGAALRNGAGLSDAQLLERFINRHDSTALAVLVRRHGPMVWGVCRRVLHNHHDAEDAFQATFLVLVRKAASIASRELLANWLYGVAYQTALKARATVARRGSRERQVTDMPEPEVVERQLWHDLQPVLDRELNGLPDKYRTPIILCDLEGKTRKEAARQLGCPEGTVAGRLARARVMLAKRLAKHGLAVSGGVLAAVLSQETASAGVPTAVVASTINAASCLVAGPTVAAGAISVKVVALTEGVLKAMRMTKLKIATAVLLVASTVALTCGALAGQQEPSSRDDGKTKVAVKPAGPPTEDQDKLQGTWRLVTAENDGLRIGEGRPEIHDDRLVFGESSFTFFYTLRSERAEPEAKKVTGDFTLDTKKNPKVITLAWKERPWNFGGKAIYALDGDTLKVCLSQGEDDKLPTDFSAPFGSKRLLWTFKREPATEKNKPTEPGAEKRLSNAAENAARPKSESSYCWLVFGPQAKLRVLVRLAGDEIAIDRDADGKFDSKDERFDSEKDCKDVEIADPDGKTSYVITAVHLLHVVPPEKFLEVRVHTRGALSYPQGAIIQLADRPKRAPEAHFNGPLTIAPKGLRITNRASYLLENDLFDLGFLVPEPLKRLSGKGMFSESMLPKSLKRDGPTDLYATVSTEGNQSRVCVCSPGDTQEERRQKAPFPQGVHPTATVEFPAKKPGDPPIKKRYPLDQFAADGLFRGQMRVPAEAGAGKAKVTFSFDTWKGANVAPTTVDIPLDEPRAERP